MYLIVSLFAIFRGGILFFIATDGRYCVYLEMFLVNSESTFSKTLLQVHSAVMDLEFIGIIYTIS